jgi:hypothetical protein
MNEPVRIYPNPATDKLGIEFASEKTESIQYQITDVTGKVIMSQRLNAQEGLNRNEINVSKISKGVYTLHVILNEKTVNVKVVIQ